MATVINDPVFGKMTYQYRWYKTEDIVLFGKHWDITIAAQGLYRTIDSTNST